MKGEEIEGGTRRKRGKGVNRGEGLSDWPPENVCCRGRESER